MVRAGRELRVSAGIPPGKKLDYHIKAVDANVRTLTQYPTPPPT